MQVRSGCTDVTHSVSASLLLSIAVQGTQGCSRCRAAPACTFCLALPVVLWMRRQSLWGSQGSVQVHWGCSGCLCNSLVTWQQIGWKVPWSHVALTAPRCPHRDSMDSVKQSAALCLLRLYKASPDLVPMGEWTARVVHLLNDQHMVRCPAAPP